MCRYGVGGGVAASLVKDNCLITFQYMTQLGSLTANKDG